MTDKTYNGWSNYETWNVALWLDNDQGSYEQWNERAQELANDFEDTYDHVAKDICTRERAVAVDLGQEIRDAMEEAQPDLGASVWSDLLSAAMFEVDWDEIAEHYLTDVTWPSAEEVEADAS